MQSLYDECVELIAFTKQFIVQEYAKDDKVVVGADAYHYFLSEWQRKAQAASKRTMVPPPQPPSQQQQLPPQPSSPPQQPQRLPPPPVKRALAPSLLPQRLENKSTQVSGDVAGKKKSLRNGNIPQQQPPPPTDLTAVKNGVQKLLPSLQIYEGQPDDSRATALAQEWKMAPASSTWAPVAIFFPPTDAAERVLYQKMAAAIERLYCSVRIISDVAAARGSKLIIVERSLTPYFETFSKEVALFPIPSAKEMFDNPTLKAEVWNGLKPFLEKLRCAN